MNELRKFDSNILNINEAFDFSKKYFSKYDFSKRCSVIDNSSKLPMDQAPYATSLLSFVDIKESDILNILKSLDANKAHGHNDISIRMLKKIPKVTFKTIITYF